MPPPPGLRKWQQLEHLSEMKWGGKQKWRREKERGRAKKEAAWAVDGWTVLRKAVVEVNVAFRLCCNFSRWEVVRRPQRSQCEDWGSRERRRFSSRCPADWLQPVSSSISAQQECYGKLVARLLDPKNRPFFFFLRIKTKWDVELKLKVEVGIKKKGLSEYNLNRSLLFRDTGFRTSHYLAKHGGLKPAYLIWQDKKSIALRAEIWEEEGTWMGFFFFSFLVA